MPAGHPAHAPSPATDECGCHHPASLLDNRKVASATGKDSDAYSRPGLTLQQSHAPEAARQLAKVISS